MSINRNALVALFIILGCSLYGQVQLSSPISILGFGQLVDRDHAFLSSVGGTRASFHARDQINSGNPASLAHLRTTVFSGGLYAARTNLRDGDNSSKIWSGNIGYLSLGMPLQNEINELFNREEHKLKGGLNLSLQPYSLTGFNFTDNELLRDENGVVIDTVVRNYIGDGSTYLLSLGTGWSYKNLSLGFVLVN